MSNETSEQFEELKRAIASGAPHEELFHLAEDIVIPEVTPEPRRITLDATNISCGDRVEWEELARVGAYFLGQRAYWVHVRPLPNGKPGLPIVLEFTLVEGTTEWEAQVIGRATTQQYGRILPHGELYDFDKCGVPVCEFCDDPATTTEPFDRAVPVCNKCKA